VTTPEMPLRGCCSIVARAYRLKILVLTHAAGCGRNDVHGSHFGLWLKVPAEPERGPGGPLPFSCRDDQIHDAVRRGRGMAE
jgi:hypothetical protein